MKIERPGEEDKETADPDEWIPPSRGASFVYDQLRKVSAQTLLPKNNFKSSIDYNRIQCNKLNLLNNSKEKG